LEVRCRREVARIVRSSADAEDVVQDALARAWRFRDSCKTPGAPEAWAATIARNEAMRFLKARGPVAQVPVEVPAELADARSARDFEAVALRIDLNRALDAGSPQERRVLHLRYQEDLPTSQIASVLRINEATARVQLHRARLALRGRLAACQEDG
jgi:RNA polymerase sigma-70 factor (ECF subfamily)